MTPNISEAFLEKWVRALAESAQAQQRGADTLVVVSSDLKAQASAIMALRDTQLSMHTENEAGRSEAVEKVLVAFRADADERSRGEVWYKRAVIILGLLIFLSNLLSAPVGQVVERLLKLGHG